jgi:ribonuclease-3
LLFHGNKTPEEIPPFEYTRGGIMCKVYFVLEDFPLNLSTQDDISSLFSFQQYLFRQLLGIQPCHLFMASTTHKCTDYHIYPRFIAVKQKPLINRQDLDAPHRIGFCLGQLMPIPKIVEYLKATSFLSAKKILEEFDPLAVIDSIVSTRINDQPAAFRIDELVYADPSETKKNTSKNKKKRIITGLKHIGTGATTFDGVIAMKKVHQWQNMGAFLQISHEVPPTEQVLVPEECHLTGFRADIFEIGSAMPMICKFVRHYTLLQSFEQSMGIQFKDKALLRQAFTHASYVDAGMQHVNTVEATVSRVRLAHTFTTDIQQLKRLRETQVSMVGGTFEQYFHNFL